MTASNDGHQARKGGYSGFCTNLLAGGRNPRRVPAAFVSASCLLRVEVAGRMSPLPRKWRLLVLAGYIMDIHPGRNGADLVHGKFNIEVKNMSFGYGKRRYYINSAYGIPREVCAICWCSGAERPAGRSDCRFWV